RLRRSPRQRARACRFPPSGRRRASCYSCPDYWQLSEGKRVGSRELFHNLEKGDARLKHGFSSPLPGRTRAGGERCSASQNLREVLVPASGETHEDGLGFEVECPCKRVRGLECGQDPLGLGQPVEGCERLLVRRGHI